MGMIEKVARALAETDGHMFSYEDQAKAAIEAMRNATPAMSDAMRMANMNIAGGYGGPSGWEAAIDAALKEQPE